MTPVRLGMAVGQMAAPLKRVASVDAEQALLAVRRVFDTVDTDGSGTLGITELGVLLETLGQPERSEAELRQTMQLMDTDNSGAVEFDEFSRMLLQWQENELRCVFAYFDRDESGEIDIAEFREALQALGQSITPEELDGLVAQADTDGSGTIGIDEFCAFVRPFMSMTSRYEYEVQDMDTGNRCELMVTSVGCELTRQGQTDPHDEVELFPYFRIADAEVEGDLLVLTRCDDHPPLMLLPR